MAFPRASTGILRTSLRAAGCTTAPHLRPASLALLQQQPAAMSQVRTMVSANRDDLGGPGGQEPPPRTPGGPPRNWVPIAGAALFFVAAFAYINGKGPPPSQKMKQAKADLADQTEIGQLRRPTKE